MPINKFKKWKIKLAEQTEQGHSLERCDFLGKKSRPTQWGLCVSPGEPGPSQHVFSGSPQLPLIWPFSGFLSNPLLEHFPYAHFYGYIRNSSENKMHRKFSEQSILDIILKRQEFRELTEERKTRVREL